MKLIVIGSGGREHAIIKKLKENPEVSEIFALPGNGGIQGDAVCIPINAKDTQSVVKFAKGNTIDFVVVVPDDPLVLGMVDALEEAGIPTFGPKKAAAQIEGSKVFAKEFMKKYNIPTAKYEVFADSEKALEYIKAQNQYPVVIKADGLALGKGVIIAQNENEAKTALIDILDKKIFGESGKRIVVEEFLSGPEVSVLAFTDGKTIKPMLSAMDHKRVLEGDIGPNTGGMGVIAPNPFYTDDIAALAMSEIFLPTIKALEAEGRTFKGCLFFGLMITDSGPKVIEYNCRFGDPESQAVLPLLKTDLFTIMRSVYSERLSDIDIEFSDKNSCCVIVASGGYPQGYETGFEIDFGGVDKNEGVYLYHSGTKMLENGKLVTSGGRVLGITALGDTLADAILKAMGAASKVRFKNAYYRKDIGSKATCS